MYRIVMLSCAVRDMEDVVNYLSQFYGSVPIKQYDRIVSKIKELSYFPCKYEEYRSGHCNVVYRRMVIDDYLVFYVVLDDVIEIHRIFHC